MSVEQWHLRVPKCGFLTSDNLVDFECSNRVQIKREIELAVQAGINYWAFVLYWPELAQSIPLQLYETEAEKRGVGFAVILQVK